MPTDTHGHTAANDTGGAAFALCWLWYGLQFYLYMALVRIALCGLALLILRAVAGIRLSRHGGVIAVVAVVAFLLGYAVLGLRTWLWTRQGGATVPRSFRGWPLWTSVALAAALVFVSLATELRFIFPSLIAYGALVLILMAFVELRDAYRTLHRAV
ncbi:MAG TPA: hypothetical protein VFQ88_03140 [Nevskiaceae bacterium]|nr:hypothetical protein [Nevskiaceae bacterium]